MRKLLLRWLINGVALYVAAELIKGIDVYGGWQVYAAMALIFGLVNALIRPILKLLTCPLIILTLGLFTLVINALMLQLAAWLGRLFELGYKVRDFQSAFLGALVISVVSFVLTLLIGDEDKDKKRR